MKLNDPFGRVSRRQSQAYGELSRQLRAQGILDPAAVAELASRVTRSALAWLLVIMLSSALALLLFPQQRALIGVIAALALVWIATGWLQTRLHLSRYLGETQAPREPTEKGGKP